MTAIEKIKCDNISITYLPDTCAYGSHYTEVVFFDKTNNDYYHTWVLIDSGNFTQIVFGCISKSGNHNAGKDINKHFDFLTNYFATRRFENIVIRKLNLDKKIISA